MASCSTLRKPKYDIIALTSSDGKTCKFNAGDLESLKIEEQIEDNCPYTSILLHNVNSKILAKVWEYCERHHEAPNSSDEDLKSFDADFVQVDHRTLRDLNLAARYLGIKSLVDLTTQAAYRTRGEMVAVTMLLELQHRMVGVE